LNNDIHETEGLNLQNIAQNGNRMYKCGRQIKGMKCNACYLFVPDMPDRPVGRLMRENTAGPHMKD
jgi:hypothetical protein